MEQNRVRLPNIDFRLAGAGETPLGPDSCDVVTAWDMIEHVPDIDEVAASVHSMLRPDGHFLFVVPVYDGPTGPIIRMLDGDPTHLHKLGRSEWLRWVSREFEVVSWEGIFRYLLPWGRYVHVPTSRLRDLSPAILVTARPKPARPNDR